MATISSKKIFPISSKNTIEPPDHYSRSEPSSHRPNLPKNSFILLPPPHHPATNALILLPPPSLVLLLIL
ncbi:hypothetical protein ACSBR1_021291 [Camellia fascicularis]